MDFQSASPSGFISSLVDERPHDRLDYHRQREDTAVQPGMDHGRGHIPQRPEILGISRGLGRAWMSVYVPDHAAFVFLEQQWGDEHQQDRPREIAR